jgi:DNA-binding beta-propeller fold protein YncE
MKSIAAILLTCAAITVSDAETLRLKASVPLPGVKGRFDHFAADIKTHRVFVAALGNNTLEIIDAAGGKRLHSITGLHKPTGVAFLPDANQIIVANGDDGTLRIFDGTGYKVLQSITALDDADNVRVDSKRKLLYVGYGDGAIGVVDANETKQTRNIKLAGHPESFQLEQQGDRIFVNVPDAKQIAVIDREKQNVIATWPMKEFQANFPMALDESNKRLFVGCRNPVRLVVFDTDAGKPVTNLAISGDTDDLFYDAARKRLYVSCGEGFIDVIDQHSVDRYEVRERIPTRSGARTCFFSAELNELYLAVPQGGQESAEIRIFQPEAR